MHRKWVWIATGIMITSMLTGCNERQGDLGNRNIREQSVRYDGNGNAILNKRFANDQMNEMNRMNGMRLNSNNLVGLHKNYRLEMSEDASARLETLKGIDKAYVMLTDNNAYVAVTLTNGENFRTESINPKTAAKNRIGRTRQAYLRPEMKDGHRINHLNHHSYPSSEYILQSNDIATGVHRMDSMNGITNHNSGMNGQDGNNNRYGSSITKHSPTSEYDLHGLHGERRYGTMTNSDHGDAIPTVLAEQITREMKRLTPQIENVYLSSNPDFVNRMASYMEDVKTGHPIQSYVAEFNGMVDRIFPVSSR